MKRERVLANVEWEDDVSQDRRDVVRGLPLYKQGASHGENAVKLSSNENPFEPLPSVIEAVTRTLPRFNRYPSMRFPTGGYLRNHSQGNGLGGISGERRPC